MKAILLVMLLAELVVQNKGLREQYDEKDLGINGAIRSNPKGTRTITGTPSCTYNASRHLAIQVNTTLQMFEVDGATRARRLYESLIKDWDKQTEKEQKDRTTALKTVADNIGAIANAKQDTTAAFVAVLEMMHELQGLNSSNGNIDSIPAIFTSSCMNLLGETVDSFSLQSIIHQETNNVMGKYYEKDIAEDIKTGNLTYFLFKSFLNMAGKDDDKINLRGTQSGLYHVMSDAYVNVFPVMPRLQNHIKRLKNGNRPADGKKLLAFVELYVKLETIRQMMLTHTLSLTPGQAGQRVIISILTALQTIKQNSLEYLRPVYDHSLQSKFMAYYDGQVYKVTNAYMAKQLRLPPRPDDFPGLSCISTREVKSPTNTTANNSTHYISFSWVKKPGKKDVYFGYERINVPCKWRIVSHGQGLYSIINKHDCPNKPWCDALLSFNNQNSNPSSLFDNKNSDVTLDHNKPVLWQFRQSGTAKDKRGNKYKQYNINPKRFCGNKCNTCYVEYTPLTLIFKKPYFGFLQCGPRNLRRKWIFSKAPLSDMVNDSGTSVTTQSSVENQEDNSVSGEEDDGVNNFTDENEILEKSKQETDEPESNQDSTENDIED